MSDQEVSELERRWRSTRSIVDETAFLRARLRVAPSFGPKLELAAYLGSSAASGALGLTMPRRPPRMEDWVTQVLALAGLAVESFLPVIYLTTESEVSEKVRVLEAGGDDFSVELMRVASSMPASAFSCGCVPGSSGSSRSRTGSS